MVCQGDTNNTQNLDQVFSLFWGDYKRVSDLVRLISSPSQLVEESQLRMDKSVLLLKESIAIETLQYQYTGRTLKTKRVKHMSCLSGFDQYQPSNY